MRVLHVFNSIEFSGAETMIANSIADFRALGVEVHCLSTGAVCGKYSDTMRDSGAKIHHIPIGYGRPSIRRLVRLLCELRCGAVHIHCERNSFLLALMARFCGTEAVLRTTHSVFLFTGRIRLQTIVARWFSRSILSVHYIFIGPSVSENETTRFLNTGQVVRNYVDERIYYPPLSPIERETVRRELCIEPGTFVLLSAGSCLEVKRHADILEAVALLMSQGIQVHYIHAGSGPLEALEVHCSRSLTVADSVRFIGVQKHMRRLYLACDCLVMPSEKEGYPMAALEAAACAAPVVAYDVYGLRDVVRDQVTGLLTSPSPEALANAIADLMSRSDRAEMGVTGHSFVLEENSRSEWIKAHIRLYAPHGISATHHSR